MSRILCLLALCLGCSDLDSKRFEAEAYCTHIDQVFRHYTHHDVYARCMHERGYQNPE